MAEYDLLCSKKYTSSEKEQTKETKLSVPLSGGLYSFIFFFVLFCFYLSSGIVDVTVVRPQLCAFIFLVNSTAGLRQISAEDSEI